MRIGSGVRFGIYLMSLTAGIGGHTRYGSVTLLDEQRLLGVCGQERITRVRGAGCNPTGLPDEALDELLVRHGRTRLDVSRFVQAGPAGERSPGSGTQVVDRHQAQAATAFLTSPYDRAAIVVCDHSAPRTSVWVGHGATVRQLDIRWDSVGFTDVYAQFAAVLGFTGAAAVLRMEALARLVPRARLGEVDRLIDFSGEGLSLATNWRDVLGRLRDEQGADGSLGLAGLAAAVQGRLSEIVLQFLRVVRSATGEERLCVGGSLFYQSALNSAIRTSGAFLDVFVPVDPGEPGLSVGAAMLASGCAPQQVSPFLGPTYREDEIKATLDNCKLPYAWESDEAITDAVVGALSRGELVGWFDGAMEWGPRALGARCILGSPSSPYVLENMNHFLKQREPWRGYAFSGLESSVSELFEGPTRAPFMECEFTPREPGRFRHALPAASAAVRVHTVDETTPRRFRWLLESLGRSTGLPYVVNTSFNGFHEPIACSPRDAVRVFYGSSLDLLVCGPFLLRK